MFQLKEHYINSYGDWRFSLGIRTPYDSYGHDKHNMLYAAAFTHSWYWRVPEFFKPKTMIRYGYTSTDDVGRDYGFSVDKTALHVHHGIQPGEWVGGRPHLSDHSKIFFIPWNEWSRIKLSYLNPDSTVFRDVFDNPNGSIRFDDLRLAEEEVPKIKFVFNDYDGEEITATCHVEQSEYRRGTSWMKWLGYIVPKKIYKRLDFKFEKEVGREKGSYKGGTMAHSCEMLPNETAIDTFTRYGSMDAYCKGWGEVNRNFTNIKQVVV